MLVVGRRGGLRPHGIPVPPEPLRAASGPQSASDFLAIGEAWAANAIASMHGGARVLDVGCGCGKMARHLVLDRSISYHGIDVLRPAIDWATAAFAAYAERFRFTHIDVRSTWYNPDGKWLSTEFCFPFGDRSFDFVICGSLFTHLLEKEMRHYLAEIARCLKPAGRMMASIHTSPEQGQSFSGTVYQIDMTPDYWMTACREIGLSLRSDLGNIWGQQVYLMEKEPPA